MFTPSHISTPPQDLDGDILKDGNNKTPTAVVDWDWGDALLVHEHFKPKIDAITIFHHAMRALYVAVFLWALPANIINLRTFLRMGLKDGVTIVFFNLTISNTILLVFLLVFSLKLNGAMLKTVSNLNRILSKVLDVFFCTSLLLTTFLAVQRSLCVVFPLHFKSMVTRNRTNVVVSAIWGYCIITEGIPLLFMRMKIIMHVAFFSTLPTIHSFENVIRTLNKIILTTVCNGFIAISIFIMSYALKKSARVRTHSDSNKTPPVSAPNKWLGSIEKNSTTTNDKEPSNKHKVINSKERAVIFQVVMVSVIYSVMHAPEFLLMLMSFNHDFLFWLLMNYDMMDTLEYLLILPVFLNIATTFFVYYKYNTRFRETCFKKG